MSKSAYSVLKTEAYNAPLNDLDQNGRDTPLLPSVADASRSSGGGLNPMLARGIYSTEALLPVSSRLKSGDRASLPPSALDRDARQLRSSISGRFGSTRNLSRDEVGSLLEELKKMQRQIEERASAEHDRIGHLEEGKPRSGLLGMIQRLEEEKKKLVWHDRALAIANTPYSLAHSFTHSWTGLGSYFKMDMFKEPPTSLRKEQDKRIDELKKEIEYRRSLLTSLQDSSAQLEQVLRGVGRVWKELETDGSPAAIAAGSSELRAYVKKTLSLLDKGLLQEDKELRDTWNSARKSVDEGLSKLVEQADLAVGTCQAVEKTVVIGGAITATGATGGLAAPLAGLAVGTTGSAGVSLGHFISNPWDFSFQDEQNRFLDDAKDSLLYGIGGGLTRVGTMGAGRIVGIATTGRVAPGPVLNQLTHVTPGVLSTASGIAYRAGSSLYHSLGGLFRRNFISHLRAGMITELPAAAWDTWNAEGTELLDPTGRLREMKISEKSLMLRYFTHRIGSAGAGGSLGSCTMGLRGLIGGAPRAAAPGLFTNMQPIGFLRRRASELVTVPDLYAQAALGVWSDYRLTGWFYGVNLDPTPEERNRMLRQAMTSGMAGRFASRAMTTGLNNIANNRHQALENERTLLQNETDNQAALVGRENNSNIVLASTPDPNYGIYFNNHIAAENALGFQFNSRRPINLARRQARNHVLSRAAERMFSANDADFTPFQRNRNQFTADIEAAMAGANPDFVFSRLIRERRGLQNVVARAGFRRGSRLRVLQDNPNEQNLEYGRRYIEDYINELPEPRGLGQVFRPGGFQRLFRNGGAVGEFAQGLRIGEFIERHRNPYGVYGVDLRTHRVNNIDHTRMNRFDRFFARASNVLLNVERWIRNAGETVGNFAPVQITANFFGGAARLASNYVGGGFGAWVTIPSASIYASWGVFAAPLTLPTLVTPYVADAFRFTGASLRIFAGAIGLPQPFTQRRGTALEVGELYTKFYEGKALRAWAENMNQLQPGSIPAPMLVRLNESINQTNQLLDQANFSRVWGIDRLRPLAPLLQQVPDPQVVLQPGVRANLNGILENEMLHAMTMQ
jgi:hypothetical protein